MGRQKGEPLIWHKIEGKPWQAKYQVAKKPFKSVKRWNGFNLQP